MSRPRRLLTIGHSYVVAMNRALPEAIAAAGAGEWEWEVTVAAPERFHADQGPMRLQPSAEGRARVVGIPARFTRRAHTLRYGRELRALLAEGWDVVHCWGEPFVLSAEQVARWTPRDAALVFATFQNLPKRYPPPFNLIERRAMRRADGWIAFGHTVAEALGARPGYRDRPHRVGVGAEALGVDAGRRVRESLGWTDDGSPVVGYLGRFVPEKGIDTLTRALDRADAPWRALLVGGGPMEADLRAWAEPHGDRVRIVTGVGHDAVPAHLNAIDVLAAPSRTTPRWKEQFGRMLVEAMACGVTVVASDSGEIPHVVGDGGRIVGEADEAGWMEAIDSLLRDPARRAALAERGLERARAEFAMPVVARRHLEFFESLAAR